jgi:uncharacterized protein YlxW (UPF0749 family)
MKTNEASIFVFIASIIIGILISLNINFNRTYNRVFLSSKQYQDAYNQRNKLRDEINNLGDQYYELYEKLLKYTSGRKNADPVDPVIQELQNELDNNKMILGTMDVEGEGIAITLKDISNDLFYNTEDEDIIDRIIHNFDITYVFNDLKNAGAEAISINGQRVIDRTEVYCDGKFLRVNGVKIATPFYITAIGNKQVLKDYIMADENYLKFLISRSIYVEVKESNAIKIQGYSNLVNTNFINPIKNK